MKRTSISSFFAIAAFLASSGCFGQKSEIIVTDRSSQRGIVTFSESYVSNGFSNNRHVDGYVRKLGTSRFLFPVGDKGMHRPFAAEADGICGAYYQQDPGIAVRYDEVSFSTDNKAANVRVVSKKEFWDIEGTNATRITLTWNSNSDIGALTDNSLNLLTIAGWNPRTQSWEKIACQIDEVGIDGSLITANAGSISTIEKIIPNNYSAFSLASTFTESIPDYKGAFESVTCKKITGWVWNKNAPEAALVVELVEGSTVIANSTAKNFRQDVKDAGYGTGFYGYAFDTPSAFADGKQHILKIRIQNSKTFIGTSRTMTCPSPPLYEGQLESMDCGSIIGWARDKNNSADEVIVELFEGSTVLANANANIYRENLPANGAVSGKYGFSIPIPSFLKNGMEHNLQVRIKGTDVLLSGSPRKLICPAPALYSGNFESASCKTISGWIWDKSNPNLAMNLELIEGANVITTMLAQNFRADVKNAGYGTGNYGFSLKTPASLQDGNSHSLKIRVKESGWVLGSARIITCAATPSSAARLASPFENDEESDWTLEAFPNPTTGNISLSFNLKNQQNAIISLTDLFGRTFWTNEVFGNGFLYQRDINLNYYQSGVYLLKVSVGSQIKYKRIALAR